MRLAYTRGEERREREREHRSAGTVVMVSRRRRRGHKAKHQQAKQASRRVWRLVRQAHGSVPQRSIKSA